MGAAFGPEAADFQLLHAWRGGDRAAGNELTARHYGSVLRFFEAKVPHAAEDLTQQAFLACVEGRGRIREGASFRPYLFAIARHSLLDYLRSTDRRRRLMSFRADAPQSQITPSRVVVMRQEQRLLMRAFDRLGPDMSIALVLYYWEGMATKEIAESMELSLTAVTTRLARARDRLRETIEVMQTDPRVQASLLSDLEGWTRSVGGVSPQ